MTGTHSVTAGIGNHVHDNIVFAFGQNLNIAANESHRAYFFGPNAAGAGGNYSQSGFLVVNRFNGDHPIHVGTSTGGNGGGAYLSAGGQWTNASSRSFKERFVQYRPAEVLEKILQLPVEGYFYKGTQEYHITPMAEDFYRLFGTGVHEIIETDSTGQLVRRPNPDVDKYLAASDVAGVALLGIQALHEENTQLRQRVSDLETENAALRARLEQLEALVQKIASTQTSP
jgi:FtsZ-binding cell division protein ZapB